MAIPTQEQDLSAYLQVPPPYPASSLGRQCNLVRYPESTPTPPHGHPTWTVPRDPTELGTRPLQQVLSWTGKRAIYRRSSACTDASVPFADANVRFAVGSTALTAR
eukprot:324877-Rhodomonas_salina.1